ncbi:MAG: hypothetical protein QXS54_11540 [Candidatus Methanomethylicaceae archaeon]
MSEQGNAMLITMLGQISGRLDRMEKRVDAIGNDLSAIREYHARLDERIRHFDSLQRALEYRLGNLESFAQTTRERFAVSRSTNERRWRLWKILGVIVGASAGWVGFIVKLLGYW